MRSKGKITEEVVLVRYYNVLFYLFFRAGIDDFKRQCLVNRIEAGESVRMKQIQEWLGHADFGTTANIYSHLDYTAKQNSANTISSVFNFVDSKDKVEEQPKQEEKDKTEELEEKLARLEEQLRLQQEDEEYQEWLNEKEKRRKRKRQSDMEM